MPKYFRAYRADEAETPADGPIRFVASTANVARDGLVIDPAGWQLEHYRANPVVLWAHDYYGSRPPIGRADVFVDGERLMADITFDRADPFAADIERKYRAGFLSAVSVGWDSLQIEPPRAGGAPRITRAELLDISAVPVPGDPDALKERQARALAQISEQLAHLVAPDGDEPVGLPWDEAACLMARVFDPGSRMTDPERRRAYNRAEKLYRQLGKRAPELLPGDQLGKLGPDELRGLFLEGEPDVIPFLFADARAGAVLSARNRGDLEQAVTLVQGVLERAKPPEQESDESGADDERATLAGLKRLADVLANTKLNLT